MNLGRQWLVRTDDRMVLLSSVRAITARFEPRGR